MSSQEPKAVDSCKGWAVPCPYCDKRFSKWLESDDELLNSDEINKPGLFMCAFDTKQGKEVVAIDCHKTDLQAGIRKELRILKQQVSQKKHKEAKSNVLVRYLVVDGLESKETCSILCHWYNYNVLPRLTTKWPGLDILKSTSHFQFSEVYNKWCHPTKDTYWKKQKAIVGPRAVKPCKGWKEKCQFCDSRFTSWMPYGDCLTVVPNEPGLIMFAVTDKGLREIVYVSDYTKLKEGLSHGHNVVSYHPDYRSHNYGTNDIEVRWMVVDDFDNENACFIYAHWFNYGVYPKVEMNYARGTNDSLPGKKMLEKHESFVFRSRDKQWCYEDSDTSPVASGSSKVKDKRNLLKSIKEDLVISA